MSKYLIAASAAEVFFLGSAHLYYTFFTNKLNPADADLERLLKAGSLIISKETNAWRCWIGFNASHSTGALLFGSVYGYLALCRPGLLRGSPFLLLLGGAHLSACLLLARRYWFSTPFRGVALASLLYAGGAISLFWQQD